MRNERYKKKFFDKKECLNDTHQTSSQGDVFFRQKTNIKIAPSTSNTPCQLQIPNCDLSPISHLQVW